MYGKPYKEQAQELRAKNERLQAENKNWKQKYQEAVNDIASLKGKIATHYRPKGE